MTYHLTYYLVLLFIPKIAGKDRDFAFQILPLEMFQFHPIMHGFDSPSEEMGLFLEGCDYLSKEINSLLKGCHGRPLTLLFPL